MQRLCALFLLLLIGCTDAADPSDDTFDLAPLIARAESTYSDGALSYLRAAFDTIRTHHVYGEAYDWEELWLATLERTLGAAAPEETHDALRFAIEDLNDPHGGFGIHPASPPSDSADDDAVEQIVEMPDMEARMIDESVAYLEIPRFGWPTGDIANAYATNVHDLIRRLAEQRPCGWIVDVRRNTGGNMWPMIAGVGPLLGEGEVGAFVDREGSRIPYRYRNGRAWLDTISVSVSGEPARFVRLPPVAVLTSGRTGSAAEAVVVAFRGRPGARTVGRPTGGAVTSPGYFDLTDEAWLRFSVLYYADRAGTVYRGPIEPDLHVDVEMWEDHAAAERAAVEWLLDTEACR